MIERFDHIVLTVKDIEASVQFYQQVLLMECVTFGAGRKALRFGNQKINLQTLGQEARNQAAIGAGDICLITSWTTEQVLAQLKKHGVQVLEGPVEKSGALGTIESVYLNDPDGHLIEVSHYK